MHFHSIVTLAWRNLWRNYRRTVIMLVAIAVGAWAMIFLTAMTRGMIDNMVAGGIATLPGHIQLHHPQYRDDPNIENSMGPPNAALLAALQSPAVKHWSGRVRVSAVVASERDSRGVLLLGIDPTRALGISAADIVEGRFLHNSDDKGLLIGAKLARRLETGLGKRVVIMSQDPDNNVVDRGLRIVGVFTAKLPSQEEIQVYTGRNYAQGMLKMGDRISEIALQGANYNELSALSQTLATAAPDLELLTWTELDPFLGVTQKMMDSVVFIYVLVIFSALSFGLVNTLVMAIFERTREIGLMLALGMRPLSIVLQTVTEALLLLTLGLLLGNTLAALTLWLLAGGIDVSAVAEAMAMIGASGRLTPSFYWQDLLLANTVVFILGVLASLLPAWRAAHLDPITALSKT